MRDITKEARKYIKFLTDILSELEQSKGVLTKEREAVLKRKVIKYKKHIEALKTLHGQR